MPTGIATWNLIILRTFFQILPQELEDSAFVDGANDVTIFVRIMLPIAKAAVGAAIALFYAVSHWNSWFPAVIYLNEAQRYPLQVILRQIVIENQMTEALLERGEMAAAQALLEEQQRDNLIASGGPQQVRHPVRLHRADAGDLPLHPALLRERPDDRLPQRLNRPDKAGPGLVSR